MNHPMVGALRAGCLATFLSISIFVGPGCTKLEKAQLGRYELGGPMLSGIIPMSGIWHIRWASGRDAPLRGLDGTEMLLYRGEPAGFEPDPEGGVVAVGGTRHFSLDQVPPEAKYLVWYHRATRQTQFGREVDKALAVTGEAAKLGAEAALIAGMTYVALQLEDDSSCACGTNCHCGTCGCWHH